MMVTAALVAFLAVANNASVVKAASNYVPGVTWQANSVVTADFSCEGRKQQAILGTAKTDTFVVIFWPYNPQATTRSRASKV